MPSLKKKISVKEINPSVNLLFDFKDSTSSLSHYILTQKGISLLSEILDIETGKDRKKRAGIISAPPGSGKSFLALFIGVVLANKREDNSIIKQIIENSPAEPKLKKEIQSKIDAYRNKGKRILPVFLIGEGENFPALLIKGILNQIKDFKDYSELLTEIGKKIGFARIVGSNEYQIDRISSSLSDNNLFLVLNLISNLLITHNFHGICLFHDEFNRFLAKEKVNISNEMNILQDYAEWIIRQKNFTYFHILLTHKSVGQYALGMPEERVNEWRKIEGRFHNFQFNDNISEHYEVLSVFISRIKGNFYDNDQKLTIEEELRKILKISTRIKTFLKDSWKCSALNSYPLHPISFLSLPFLSQLIGQNERTLFNFIIEIYKNSKNRKSLIYLPELFDQFDSFITSNTDRIALVWEKGRHGLKESNSEKESKIIKALTIFSVIDMPNFLPASIKEISLSTNLSETEVTFILHNLQKRNLAIYKSTSDFWYIHSGSSIDWNSQIELTIQNLEQRMIRDAIEKEVVLPPIYSHQYNQKFSVNRYFIRRFLFESQISEIIDVDKNTNDGANVFEDWNYRIQSELFKNYCNQEYTKERAKGALGIIWFVLPDRHSRFASFLNTFWNANKGIPHFFILPEKNFLNVSILNKFAAISILKKNRSLISSDPKSILDLNIMESDLKESIKLNFKELFKFSNSKVLTETSLGKLEDQVEEYIAGHFKYTPSFHMELINRESVSPNIRNARKKILRYIIAGSKNILKEFSGYGPEVAIFRAIFVAKSLYVKISDEQYGFDFSSPKFYNHKFSSRKEDIGLKKVISEIRNFIVNSKSSSSFSIIYDILLNPPFGLSKEIIPILLLAVLQEGRFLYTITEEGKYLSDINSDDWERIHLNPEKFFIKVLPKEIERDEYLQELISIFSTESLVVSGLWKSKNIEHENSQSLLDKTTVAVLRWMGRIPEYSKHFKNLSPQARGFLDSLENAESPEDLFFLQIPNLLLSESEKNYSKFPSKLLILNINKIRHEIEQVYPDFLKAIMQAILEIIPVEREDKYDIDYRTFRDYFLSNNAIRINLIRESDIGFKRFLERFEQTYDTEDKWVESLGSLLLNQHPRYWKETNLAEFKFALIKEISKLKFAEEFARGEDSKKMKLERLRLELNALSELERAELIEFYLEKR